MQEEIDFFISYHQTDQEWAEWIAYQLEEKGYRCIIRVWDFLPGSNSTHKLNEALKQTKRVLMVLSPDYLAHQSEWTAAFTINPDALLPVRVRECKLSGLLASIISIDLVSLREEAARERLLTDIQGTRLKPSQPPLFPSTVPEFPHLDNISIDTFENLPAKEAIDDVSSIFVLSSAFKSSKNAITRIAWSPSGDMLASVHRSEGIQIWDVTTKHVKRSFGGKINYSIAWSPDGTMLASSDRSSLHLWDVATGELQSTLKIPNKVNKCLAWSPDGRILASGSDDNTIRLWDPVTGHLLHQFTDHAKSVNSVAWSPDGRTLVSGSDDNTIRLWNPATEQLIDTFFGHFDSVNCVIWSPDGQTFASASSDNTIRVWDFEERRLSAIIEGHTKPIICLAFSYDGRLLASKSLDGTVRLWQWDTGKELAKLDEPTSSYGWYASLTFHPTKPRLATLGKQDTIIRVWDLDMNSIFNTIQNSSTIEYTSAKVVLVGDQGVGKTCLGRALTDHPFVPPESTHGRTVRLLNSPEFSTNNKIREILLWDLAGQTHYRLIHQLYMNEVALSLIVFNPHNSVDSLSHIKYWSSTLRVPKEAQGNVNLLNTFKTKIKNFLVATHMDLEGRSVSRERIGNLMRDLRIDDYFETSAKEGTGIAELVGAIKTAINWETLPTIHSITLFQSIKDFIVTLRKSDRDELPSVRHLYRAFLLSQHEMIDDEDLFSQFETCLTHMDSQGLIKKINFSNHILLKPELLDYYVSALIDAVLLQHDSDGLGSIPEENVMEGDFDIPSRDRLQDKGLEKILLTAMVAYLQHHEIMLRENSDDGPYLVFPSLVTREFSNIENIGQPAITFYFDGPVPNIYATLAVRLSHSSFFKKKDMGKDTITFTFSDIERDMENNAIISPSSNEEIEENEESKKIGIYGLLLRSFADDSGELTLFFNEYTSNSACSLFINYVHAHLKSHAIVKRIKRINQEDVIESNQKSLLEDQKLISEMNRAADAQRNGDITSTIYKDKQMIDDIKEKQRISAAKIAAGDYDLFISYNHKDRKRVLEIGELLKNNGIAPWLDEWDLQPGLPWQPLIEQQIKNIKAAATFVGEIGLGSWQKMEIDALLRAFVKRGRPVIPVLLDGAPYEPELPIFLEGMTWVDFRQKDPDPLERLIWGITGKRPGKIYRPGILIASLGESPVVVSSMYDLLREREKLTIDRITVLAPKGEEVQNAYDLVKDTLIAVQGLEVHYEPLDFEDADSWTNACIFLQKLYHLLDHYQKQGDSVYLSLAGGRKSMAALIAWVVPFFSCVKKLYHVIDKEDENFRSANDIKGKSSAIQRQRMHPDLDQLTLIEIPFEKEEQISAKLRSHFLASSPRDYEKAEALITGQTIFQQGDISHISLTDLARAQFLKLCKENKEQAQRVHNGLLKMHQTETLHDNKAGADAYPYKAAKTRRVSLHYFTGLQEPIRPVFYTLPTDIYTNPAPQIKQVVICSLESASPNGKYRTLEEVSVASDFSILASNALPPVPSPVDSILIVPLGTSPMVATQLYTLLTEQEQHTIHEVILIYPERAVEVDNGAELVKKALYEEYGVVCTPVPIPDLDDIASEDDCRKYQTHLEGEIDRIRQKYPKNYKIDLALSGGRKGMTAMTIFAAQKHHIPYVYHTLITDRDISDRIDEETSFAALHDTELSQEEQHNRLFLREYESQELNPYANFTLFRVPVLSSDGW